MVGVIDADTAAIVPTVAEGVDGQQVVIVGKGFDIGVPGGIGQPFRGAAFQLQVGRGDVGHGVVIQPGEGKTRIPVQLQHLVGGGEHRFDIGELRFRHGGVEAVPIGAVDVGHNLIGGAGVGEAGELPCIGAVRLGIEAAMGFFTVAGVAAFAFQDLTGAHADPVLMAGRESLAAVVGNADHQGYVGRNTYLHRAVGLNRGVAQDLFHALGAGSAEYLVIRLANVAVGFGYPFDDPQKARNAVVGAGGGGVGLRAVGGAHVGAGKEQGPIGFVHIADMQHPFLVLAQVHLGGAVQLVIGQQAVVGRVILIIKKAAGRGAPVPQGNIRDHYPGAAGNDWGLRVFIVIQHPDTVGGGGRSGAGGVHGAAVTGQNQLTVGHAAQAPAGQGAIGVVPQWMKVGVVTAGGVGAVGVHVGVGDAALGRTAAIGEGSGLGIVDVILIVDGDEVATVIIAVHGPCQHEQVTIGQDIGFDKLKVRSATAGVMAVHAVDDAIVGAIGINLIQVHGITAKIIPAGVHYAAVG